MVLFLLREVPVLLCSTSAGVTLSVRPNGIFFAHATLWSSFNRNILIWELTTPDGPFHSTNTMGMILYKCVAQMNLNISINVQITQKSLITSHLLYELLVKLVD